MRGYVYVREYKYMYIYIHIYVYIYIFAVVVRLRFVLDMIMCAYCVRVRYTHSQHVCTIEFICRVLMCVYVFVLFVIVCMVRKMHTYW